LGVGAELGIQIGDHISVTPGVYFSSLMSTSLRHAVDKADQWWGGVNFAFSF
jgi:hypothetical protein